MLAQSAMLDRVHFGLRYHRWVGQSSAKRFLAYSWTGSGENTSSTEASLLYDSWHSQVIAPMLVIYRVVRRAGRESMTVLPEQYDMSKPKLQVSTGMGYGLSVSRSISIRGCDSPYNSLPPPYAKDPFNDFPIGTFPQTPTARPAHMWPVQKLGIKQ